MVPLRRLGGGAGRGCGFTQAEDGPATISPATNQPLSIASNLTAPLGRAGAAWRWPGCGRRIVLGPTSLGQLGPFVSVLLRAPDPHDALLFRDLPLEDSVAIAGRPEARSVPFRREVTWVDAHGRLPAPGGAAALRGLPHR
jgi:hypothetical protein